MNHVTTKIAHTHSSPTPSLYPAPISLKISPVLTTEWLDRVYINLRPDAAGVDYGPPQLSQRHSILVSACFSHFTIQPFPNNNRSRRILIHDPILHMPVFCCCCVGSVTTTDMFVYILLDAYLHYADRLGFSRYRFCLLRYYFLEKVNFYLSQVIRSSLGLNVHKQPSVFSSRS